jgi:hypothetical protein
VDRARRPRPAIHSGNSIANATFSSLPGTTPVFQVIRRMLDPEHATKAEKIQAALAALGKQLTVDVRDAA